MSSFKTDVTEGVDLAAGADAVDVGYAGGCGCFAARNSFSAGFASCFGGLNIGCGLPITVCLPANMVGCCCVAVVFNTSGATCDCG